MEEAPRPVAADTHGRVRMPAVQRERILAEFAASGMTAVAFAALVGVKYPTFAGWVRLRRAGRKPLPVGRPRRAPVAPVRFVEAQRPSLAPPPRAAVTAVSPAPALELELPGGARLLITELSQVPMAVELLKGLRPC
jgi:hypothetical protein